MAATIQGLAMRFFLATAAILFAVTAAQAQSAGPSADDKAVQAIIEKLKVTRAVKTDAKPAEVAPAEAKQPAPTAAAARPAEAGPAQTAPATIETKPAESKPVEARPVDVKPAEARPVQTEKKRVVKARENQGLTARQLADKYGIQLDLE
jgi:hypothetical protein